MNVEIKALLQMVFDMIKVGEGAIAKQDFITQLLPALYKLASDVPAVVSHWDDLLPELQALASAPADEDLLAFIMSLAPGLTDSSKAQMILAAAADLALCVGQKGYALEQALKG